MAITTLDGVIAGAQVPQFFFNPLSGTLVAGRPHSLAYVTTAGSRIPGAAAAPSPGIAGAALTTYAGQIPFPTISSGNRYLARMVGSSHGQGGSLTLYDRLWHNSGINVSITSSQTINSVTWPARDNDGATAGAGVLIGVEVTTALGAGTPSYTLNYTNSAGTSGRSGANIVATAATAIVGTFTPIGLAAGDVGVRSIQQFTLSATHTSGAISLVAYRPIVTIELAGVGLPQAVDAVTGGMPRMYADSVPFHLFTPATTTTTRIHGHIVYTDG